MAAKKATWSGQINFGMISIPVKLYSAAEDGSGVKFRQLNAETNNPIKLQKIDSVTGEVVKETVKGYEVEKDNFVIVTDDEIAELLPDKSSTIELITFVEEDEIEQIYIDKPYYLGTDGADKPYRLLESALRDKKKVAVGKFVMRSKEYLCLIRPASENGLSVSTLRWHDQVRDNSDIVPENIEIKEKELALAGSLIDAMTEGVDMKALKETYTGELKVLLADKASGAVRTVKKAEKQEEQEDIFAALEASLASMTKEV